MRRFTLLLAVCCVCLMSAHASDDAAKARATPEDKTTPSAKSVSAKRVALSPEQFRKSQAAFQGFLKPESIDPAATVIRVYDADGVNYEERTIRFGSLSRSFVQDLQQRAEKDDKQKTQSVLGAAYWPLEESLAIPSFEYDPRLLAPVELFPTVSGSNPCQ